MSWVGLGMWVWHGNNVKMGKRITNKLIPQLKPKKIFISSGWVGFIGLKDLEPDFQLIHFELYKFKFNPTQSPESTKKIWIGLGRNNRDTGLAQTYVHTTTPSESVQKLLKCVAKKFHNVGTCTQMVTKSYKLLHGNTYFQFSWLLKISKKKNKRKCPIKEETMRE